MKHNNIIFCQNTKLDDIFSENIKYSICKISDHDNIVLCPDEYKLIEKANNKRRNEFISGRIAAKNALKKLGIDRVSILSGASREPVWPHGIVGSISHCDTFAVSVVAFKNDLKSLGIDIEPATCLSKEIEEKILTKNEKYMTESLKNIDANIPWSKIIFSAKESAFKCIYPLQKKYLDFDEAEIDFDENGTSFNVKNPLRNKNEFLNHILSKIEGKYLTRDGLIITISAIY